MPELVQEILSNIPRFGAVFALFPVCFKVFAWVEDRLSINAKEEISAWLKSTGNFAANQILLFNLSHFHGKLFDDKQFSLKCVRRTMLFSFISYILIFSPLFVEFIIFLFQAHENDTKFLVTFPWQAQSPVSGDWTGGVAGIMVLLFIFILVVLPLDFFGIGITRILAMRAGNNIGLKSCLFIFLFDTLAKAIIFPIIYVIFVVTIVSIVIVIMIGVIKIFIHGDVPVNIFDLIDIIIINSNKTQLISTLYAAFALYKSLVPCFLLCSAWVWLYLIGLHLVRRAVFLFDVDKQPVRSIGIIGAAVLTVCYGVYTVIGPNLSLGSPLNPDEIAYLEQQNSDSAIAGLNAAIRFNPKSPGLLTLRAGAYWQKHNYDSAIADLNAAIELNPSSASLFVARGNNYHAKRDYDRAIADNSEAIRLDPKYAIAFNNRGWAYAAKQDYDRAIADYSESIRIDPKYALAFDNRGLANAAMNDYDRAIADHSDAIRLGLGTALSFAHRGRAYIGKQEYDPAIADCTRAIKLDPKFAFAFSCRGIAYFAKQDYGGALASLSEAVRLAPESAVSILWLYLVHAHSDAEAAVAELNTNAKKLNHSNWPYPLVELFLGRRSLETALAAATRLSEQCAAEFYVGEWRLLGDDRSAAQTSMKAALEICPKNLIEYDVARSELRRLPP